MNWSIFYLVEVSKLYALGRQHKTAAPAAAAAVAVVLMTAIQNDRQWACYRCALRESC